MPTPLWGLFLLDYLQVYFFSVSQFLVFLIPVVLFSLFEKTFLHLVKYCEGCAHPACGEVRLLQGWREVLLARMLVIPSVGLGLIDGSLDVCLDPWYLLQLFCDLCPELCSRTLGPAVLGGRGVG